MKKLLIAFALLMTVFAVSAQEVTTGEYNYKVIDTTSSTPYEVISLTFWYDTPPASAYTETYGIKGGAPFGVGAPVYGLEASVLGSMTDVVYGVQTSLVMCKAQEIKGLQFSVVNVAEEMCGLQLGVVNLAERKSFQIGLLNYLEDSSLFPFLPIFNFKF